MCSFEFNLAYNSMFSLCSPCTRHYNAVIKMETFSEDSRFSIFWQIIYEGKCVQVYFETAWTWQTSARESQQQSRKSDSQEGGGDEAVQGHPHRGHRQLGPEVEAGLWVVWIQQDFAMDYGIKQNIMKFFISSTWRLSRLYRTTRSNDLNIKPFVF